MRNPFFLYDCNKFFNQLFKFYRFERVRSGHAKQSNFYLRTNYSNNFSFSLKILKDLSPLFLDGKIVEFHWNIQVIGKCIITNTQFENTKKKIILRAIFIFDFSQLLNNHCSLSWLIVSLNASISQRLLKNKKKSIK